jgi:DNA replication protein
MAQTTEPKRTARWEISKRWTPDLVEDGYTGISGTFLEHYASLGITSSEAMLIIHLISYKWDQKHPYPRFALIASRMGMTETAVRGHARRLEKKGLLHRIKRPGTSNEFDLSPLFKKLEQIHA